MNGWFILQVEFIGCPKQHPIEQSLTNMFFLGKIFVTNEITGRFGGDEFIVFIKNNDNMDAVKNIAEEIITGASQNVILPDNQLIISISIGVAIYSGHETNYSDLFKKADIALYKAKANPDKRFYVYE